MVTVRKNLRKGSKKIADKNRVLTAYDNSEADNTSAINKVNSTQAAPKGTPKIKGKVNDKSSNTKKEKTDVQPRTGAAERERGHEPRQKESLEEGAKHEDERTGGKEDFNDNRTDNGGNGVNLQYGNESGQDNDGSARNDSGTVAQDATRSVASNRDRSAIRSYEEGLADNPNDNTEYSERDRLEAESERLVSIALANGGYFDKGRTASLGERYPKTTR